MSTEEKINWLFIYVDSRSPTIRPEAHNRHWNEIREQVHSMIYKLNFPENLSELSEDQALKLLYSLYRGRTNMTTHITEEIGALVQSLVSSQKLSSEGAILFFIYFSEI